MKIPHFSYGFLNLYICKPNNIKFLFILIFKYLLKLILFNLKSFMKLKKHIQACVYIYKIQKYT